MEMVQVGSPSVSSLYPCKLTPSHLFPQAVFALFVPLTAFCGMSVRVSLHSLFATHLELGRLGGFHWRGFTRRVESACTSRSSRHWAWERGNASSPLSC